MKGSVNKGFITYLLLFLGMIIGVVLVCLTIMMFSPGVDILGYIYYTENSRTTIKNFNGVDMLEFDGQNSIILDEAGNEVQPVQNTSPLHFVNLEKVIIKTNGIAVNFIHGQEDRIDVIRNVSGFAKAQDFPEFNITKQYNSATKTLTITAFDQNLLFTLTSISNINVIIPNNTPGVAYEVETTTAPVTFAVKEFSNLVARNLQAKSLTVSTQTGAITVGDVATITSVLNLSTEKANIELLGALGASQTNRLSTIDLEVGEGNITTQNLYASDITFKGNNTFALSKTIYGNVKMSIIRGNFESLDIHGNVVDSDEAVINTRIIITEVLGEFTIPSSESSYINLGSVSGTAYIRSQSGSVVIKNALGIVDIETTTGAVSVLFNSTAAANIHTDRGTITVLFNVMNGQKNITSTSGAIVVYHKDGLAFKMVATSDATINLVSENLTFTDQTITGYPTQAAAEFETADMLTLTTGNANITVTRKVAIAWTIVEPAA